MKHILLAEDDTLLQKGLHDALVRAGYQVTAVGTGDDAVAKALELHPDALLLDILMPGMDGLEALRILREDVWGKTVPVMVLSNQESSENIMQAVQESAQAYFIKSDTSLNTILESVAELVA